MKWAEISYFLLRFEEVYDFQMGLISVAIGWPVDYTEGIEQAGNLQLF